MYIISFSYIIYTYCKLILKSPSGRINKSIVLYCIVLYCIVKEWYKTDLNRLQLRRTKKFLDSNKNKPFTKHLN